MNKKLFHIEFKNSVENEKHFYYGDLTILFKNRPSEKVGISKHTLDRKEFQFPFDNEICTIRKNKLVTSKRSVK